MSDLRIDRPFTPKHLVEKDMMLNVPVYQRLFVWKDDQIQNLLSDLYGSYKSQSNGLYNVGIISVWVNAKENNIWDVVDGQQRLTFLSLFAAWNVAKLPRDSVVRNLWQNFLFVGKKLRISFTGRPDDEEDIKLLATRKMPQSGAFRCFAETADVFFAKLIDAQKSINLEGFAQYVYNNCAFLVDILPDGYGSYELNLYFEKMNSTGRQLEPIDMVKGMYFAKFARRWNKVFRIDGECSQEDISIADIISNKGNETVDKESSDAGGTDDSTAETKRLVSDEVMLLHSLRIVNGGDGSFSLDKSHLLEMFSKYFSDKSKEEWPNKADLLLKVLENYSLWMDKHIIRIAKDEKQGANRYIFVTTNDDDIEVCEHSQDSEKDDRTNPRSRRLKQFESMLFVSSDDSQDWIMRAYLLREGKDTKDDDLLTVLKKIDAERHPFPGVGSAENNSWSYGKIDRYWFWKLDYMLWEQHEENRLDTLFSALRKENGDNEAISNYVFRKDRSIEHLHPQNPTQEGEDDDWANDRNDNKDAVRNSFGNLAMISSSFNSTQSNDSISTKMGRIDDQVREKRLQSIKLLLMVRSVKSNPAGWTVEATQMHGKQMLAFLKEKLGG